MRKIYALLAFMAIGFMSAQSAAIYENYVVLKLGAGQNTYYDLASTTANPDFQGANLGAFYTASSLVVSGGQNKTAGCNGGKISAGAVYYRVTSSSNASPAFASIKMDMTSTAASQGGCENQVWEGLSGTSNVLAGLAPGEYRLEVYTTADSNLGTIYSNNNGNYFVASFTVTGDLSTADYGIAAKRSKVADGKLFTEMRGDLEISVFDAAGRLISSKTMKANGNPIDLAVQRPGVYLVKISNSNSNEVVRFIK